MVNDVILNKIETIINNHLDDFYNYIYCINKFYN